MSDEDNDEARPGCLIWMVVGMMLLVTCESHERLARLERQVDKVEHECHR